MRVVQLSPRTLAFFNQRKTDTLLKALEDTGIRVSAQCAGYQGESYADMEAVRRTVGLVNPATRERRVEETQRFADFAAEMEVRILTSHIGVIPEDRTQGTYKSLVETMGSIADYCASNGVTFAMETGQETAELMVEFMKDVDNPNLRINFDPANMILYNSGDPIKALETLKPYVVHVHVKDGLPPKEDGKLGTEVPLGEGKVGIEAYVAKLKEIGYQGPLIIEREGGSDRIGDITRAKALLERLL